MSGSDILILLALLPAFVLCFYVFKKDRADKEPIGLLISLLFFGALSCFPAAFLETVIGSVIDGGFLPYGEASLSLLDGSDLVAYNLITYFLGVGLIEEGVKWLVMFLRTNKHRAFNSLFDGIIYAVFVSLGFAALENIFYVTDSGFEVAVLRAVISVPGHAFFGVIMGYFYTMYHAQKNAQTIESDLRSRGAIPEGKTAFRPGLMLLLSIVVPTLAHGFFDFSISMDSEIFTVAFYVFVIALYVFCFRAVRKISKKDAFDNTAASRLVLEKYPQAAQWFKWQ